MSIISVAHRRNTALTRRHYIGLPLRRTDRPIEGVLVNKDYLC